MAISAGIAIAEIAGLLAGGSLVLVADAAHMAADAAGLAANQGAAMLDALQGCLRGHFDVVHSTFQLEPAGHADTSLRSACERAACVTAA